MKIKISSKQWLRALKTAVATGICLPTLLHAQETEAIRLQSPEFMAPTNLTKTSAPKPEDSQKILSAQVRFESMEYFTPVKDVPDLTHSQYLTARFVAEDTDPRVLAFAYKTDLSAGTFFRKSQSHYVVHELNASTHVSAHTALTLGRKKSHWSELDQRWQLSLWQPNFAIDALRPDSQGLTGLFVDYSREDFQLLLFASPIFIPNMGPEIREEGGSLVSDSRWYRRPSSEYNFSNNINSIVYRLDIPETNKLVFNPSSAMMLRLGKKNDGPWMTASWGYKPVNDLVLKRQNFKAVADDRVDVTVSPLIGFHNITSADIGYGLSDVQLSASYLTDQPQDVKIEEEWAVQRLQPIQATSVQLDWSMRHLLSREVQLQLNYLKVKGGGIMDVAADGSPDDFTMFDRRLKFTDAVSVGLEGEFFRLNGRALVTKFKYLFDWEQKGSLINTELLYFPDARWAFLVGADVLGVQDETVASSGFLNQYRANDRFYGGMTYVF